MSIPTAIGRQADGAILITWDDGDESRWSPGELRRLCPCATCREKKRAAASPSAKPIGLPVISAAEARPLTVESMRPVGNYAYNISFSDGHGSGIFPFPLLRREPSTTLKANRSTESSSTAGSTSASDADVTGEGR